jgi:hypothetical protein
MSNDRDQSSRRPASSGRAATFLRRIRHQITSTRVRVPLVWWRHQGLKAGDVMLGSYPRSGSTWLRFTLFEILTGEPSGFENVNAAFRGLSDYKDGWPLLPGGGRFIGTHEPNSATYRRAIYLVRDVRDVALSEYAYEKNRGVGRKLLDDYLKDMLLGRKRHGSWQDHVQSWLDSPLASDGNLLLIRYEDLRRDSVAMLMKLVNFLGVAVDRSTVEKAVANTSLERMREKEDRLYKQENYSAVPRRPLRGTQPNERFVRSGKVGGWQEQLSQEQLRLIEQYTANVLLRLEYPVLTVNGVETSVHTPASVV